MPQDVQAEAWIFRRLWEAVVDPAAGGGRVVERAVAAVAEQNR
jgi:hypothetical protein